MALTAHLSRHRHNLAPEPFHFGGEEVSGGVGGYLCLCNRPRPRFFPGNLPPLLDSPVTPLPLKLDSSLGLLHVHG